MLVIGLTGGIGSGKSTVARFFAELGVPIIDTDVIARDVVKPGADALKKIVEKFGENIVASDGSLDRTELRGEIFKDGTKRQWLEALLHPLIRSEALRQVSTLNAPYCIIVIPLLTEPAPNPFIDRVLVVDIDEQTQLERACARDKNGEEQMKKIIAAQITREQRLAIANDVIQNNSDLESLRAQVEQLDKKYTKKRI